MIYCVPEPLVIIYVQTYLDSRVCDDRQVLLQFSHGLIQGCVCKPGTAPPNESRPSVQVSVFYLSINRLNNNKTLNLLKHKESVK